MALLWEFVASKPASKRPDRGKKTDGQDQTIDGDADGDSSRARAETGRPDFNMDRKSAFISTAAADEAAAVKVRPTTVTNKAADTGTVTDTAVFADRQSKVASGSTDVTADSDRIVAGTTGAVFRTDSAVLDRESKVVATDGTDADTGKSAVAVAAVAEAAVAEAAVAVAAVADRDAAKVGVSRLQDPVVRAEMERR